MSGPRIALLYCSVHHGNTLKLLQAAASQFPMELLDVTRPWTLDLDAFDVLGFASGVFYGKMHKKLHHVAASLNFAPRHQAFLICTQGAPRKKYGDDMQSLLARKGVRVLARFNCLGWDSWGPFKLVGGIHKNRPDDGDVQRAVTFLRQMAAQWQSDQRADVTP